jgi:hypothetical protein
MDDFFEVVQPPRVLSYDKNTLDPKGFELTLPGPSGQPVSLKDSKKSITYIGYTIGRHRYFFTPASNDLVRIWTPNEPQEAKEGKALSAKEVLPVQPDRDVQAKYTTISMLVDQSNQSVGVLLIDENILPQSQDLDPVTFNYLAANKQEDYKYFYEHPDQLALSLNEHPRRIKNLDRIQASNIESENDVLIRTWNRTNQDRKFGEYTTTQFDSIYDVWGQDDPDVNLAEFKHIMFGGPAPKAARREAAAAAAPAPAARPVGGRLPTGARP